jgi:hypothetical protein
MANRVNSAGGRTSGFISPCRTDRRPTDQAGPRPVRARRVDCRVPVLAATASATLAGHVPMPRSRSGLLTSRRGMRAGPGPADQIGPDLATISRMLTSGLPGSAGRRSRRAGQLAAGTGKRRLALAMQTVRDTRTASQTAPRLMASLDHATGTLRGAKKQWALKARPIWLRCQL